MKHPLIAREGWLFILVAFGLAVVVTVFASWWSLPLWLLAAFVLQFFRDPPRLPDSDDVVTPQEAESQPKPHFSPGLSARDQTRAMWD